MEACKFFIFIFLIFTFMEILDGKVTSNVCNHDKPHIQFPFKVNSICKHNQTMLKLQGYSYLGAKSVSYDPNKLTLFDPKDCVFEVFLNLNLESTHFWYYHVVKKNYTYLNCSTDILDSFEPVPCLSGSNHRVYVVESPLHVPASCEVVKTVLIPFAYSSFVSDDSFGLDLTWDSVGSKDFGFLSIGEGNAKDALTLR
ncbi:hypothetical protein HanXRQr2_Chr03g0132601 [Helianthus annuus]|uniref:RING-type E3 ubiquitin transferase n=1 Tax=Helianthus annuus TaxID=4232 RepID=A0A251VAJ7_HELAN|nr:hypothetical protein HanXRQr2_Chr03g0132601 [Helianthus annuus]KAJ0769691.1 hypothetical protein HanLR1_Chr03g0115501 [Helianthus annuus]